MTDMTILAIILGGAGLFLLVAFVRIFLPAPRIFPQQGRKPYATVDTSLSYHGLSVACARDASTGSGGDSDGD